ncbi:MAK10-like protein, partial [Tanacetum coccineum]
MENKNPIRALGDYSKPSHEGYRNTIELPIGNNVVPLRSDTIRLWLERLPAGSISTWEDLTTHFLAQFFPPGMIAKLRNDILMFQQHQGESLLFLKYEYCEIDSAAGGKLRDKNADESWEIIENLALYNYEGWNDSKDFIKPVKDISILLKELTASRTLEKGGEEKSDKDNAISGDSIENPDGSDAIVPLKGVKKGNEAENRIKNKPVKSAKMKLTQIEEEELVETPSSQPVGYYLKHKINKKLVEGLTENQRFNDFLSVTRIVDQGSDINVMPLSIYKRLTVERPTETDIRLSLASLHIYIYPLRIAEDVLVDVAAKAVIKFDKGTITLRSGKSKISFHRIPETLCRIKKGTKNDIDPIAPTMTVNSKIFENECPAPVKEEYEVKDEGGVT